MGVRGGVNATLRSRKGGRERLAHAARRSAQKLSDTFSDGASSW